MGDGFPQGTSTATQATKMTSVQHSTLSDDTKRSIVVVSGELQVGSLSDARGVGLRTIASVVFFNSLLPMKNLAHNNIYVDGPRLP